MTINQDTASAAPATRRKALIRIGAGPVGFAAVTAGFGRWVLQRPEAKLLTTHCAKDASMTKRVLIASATRAGSSGEIARKISERLCTKGFGVDVRPVGTVQTVEGCQAIVLGSAIRFSAWLPQITQFVGRNKAALAGLPAAAFSAGLWVAALCATHATWEASR